MNEPMILKDARFILTMDGGVIRERSSVRIEDGKISRVGDVEHQRGDEVVDCSSSIVMPGLVNAHTHSAMVLLRGLNDDAPLDEWLSSMWEVEGRLTPEMEEIGAELGYIEMIRTGTTACIDMYGAFQSARAARRTGIRMANGPPLISIFGSTEERLDQTRDFIDEFRDDDLIIPVMNLHSIYTNDEEAMIKAGELSRKENIPLNAHCSETRKEAFENRRNRGRLAVEELDRNGCLWEKTVLAHLGWASSWEFNRIRETGTRVVHSPNSNRKLGTGGFFPFKDLKEMGIVTGLGTDGPASNNSLDMFREMRSMALTQKNQYWDPVACTAEDALHSATVNGNSILGITGGKVSEGMNADLIVMGIGPGMMPLRRDNLMSALVYAATGSSVKMTMVGGNLVHDNGRLGNGEILDERYLNLIAKVEDTLGL